MEAAGGRAGAPAGPLGHRRRGRRRCLDAAPPLRRPRPHHRCGRRPPASTRGPLSARRSRDCRAHGHRTPGAATTVHPFGIADRTAE
ncbi:hypothetical protein Ae706Ps2_0076c [Pseudonocardia sp. Ae706_Ps2]|nr:hypothetical protein Ae331Ps2_5842 [Pseudonocardia sp. Ae331_Ps2]OLM13637.1 hypothetical protein Ae505Ps2_3765c [Pseudonocardia sp. Ae505_Ps2]OLM21644.1 hypothetical protein Ae706Ps2_0076c [Pseudonocardia sp. Ae706_Ps2]